MTMTARRRSARAGRISRATEAEAHPAEDRSRAQPQEPKNHTALHDDAQTPAPQRREAAERRTQKRGTRTTDGRHRKRKKERERERASTHPQIVVHRRPVLDHAEPEVPRVRRDRDPHPAEERHVQDHRVHRLLSHHCTRTRTRTRTHTRTRTPTRRASQHRTYARKKKHAARTHPVAHPRRPPGARSAASSPSRAPSTAPARARTASRAHAAASPPPPPP